MQKIPGHITARYTAESEQDALFHYTTVSGLLGVMQSESLWSTAYYAANDESELSMGEKALSTFCSERLYALEKEKSKICENIRRHGVRPSDCAEEFARLVPGLALSALSTFISCFCRPKTEEDFLHGLLSQWRGYGQDGGYAIQFSRKRLLKAIEKSNTENSTSYDLEDVHYEEENPLKESLRQHENAFGDNFERHLVERGLPLHELIAGGNRTSPLKNLTDGPLQALLNYVVYSKNKHFSEENETRLSLVQPSKPCSANLPVNFYSRNGLLVPYIETPKAFNVLSCIDWIIIGPSPRMESRMRSIHQLVMNSGYDIKVRPSHIPFTRL